MQVWNVLNRARYKYRTQKVVKKSPSGHHRTTLSGYIFATKARIDNREKHLFSSNISSTRSHNMVNFSPLPADIGPLVWGTPTNFNGFRVLASLLQGTPVSGVSQTLRRWTKGATYIRQGAITLGIGPHSTLYYFSLHIFPISIFSSLFSSYLYLSLRRSSSN